MIGLRKVRRPPHPHRRCIRIWPPIATGSVVIWAIVCGGALFAAAATAQTLPRIDPPAAIRDALEQIGPLDSVSAWPWDFDGDGTTDYLVQAAYPFPGGNAVQFGYYAYVARRGGFVQTAQFNLTGGIESVRPSATGLTLTMTVLRDGDPRCCPSGRRAVQLNF